MLRTAPRSLIVLLVALILASSAGQSALATRLLQVDEVAVTKPGIDVAGMDRSVNPADDQMLILPSSRPPKISAPSGLKANARHATPVPSGSPEIFRTSAPCFGFRIQTPPSDEPAARRASSGLKARQPILPPAITSIRTAWEASALSHTNNSPSRVPIAQLRTTSAA